MTSGAESARPPREDQLAGDRFGIHAEQLDEATAAVRIHGEVEQATAGKVEAALLDAGRDGAAVLVDASGCTFIDSSGMRALLVAWRELAAGPDANRMVVFAPPDSAVRWVLEITGIQDALQVVESEEEGLRELRRPAASP